jgi:hypothetical protein
MAAVAPVTMDAIRRIFITFTPLASVVEACSFIFRLAGMVAFRYAAMLAMFFVAVENTDFLPNIA